MKKLIGLALLFLLVGCSASTPDGQQPNTVNGVTLNNVGYCGGHANGITNDQNFVYIVCDESSLYVLKVPKSSLK